MTTSVDVRGHMVDLLRRDLFGPHPDRDPDLEREVLQDKPSRFYVGGFIVPTFDGPAPAATDEDEEAEKTTDDLLAAETLDSPIEPAADEQETPDQPPKDRFLPSSIGLTVIAFGAGARDRAAGDLGRLSGRAAAARDPGFSRGRGERREEA